VKQDALEKRGPFSVKETSQYGLAFGVVALMLWVVGFPVFLLLFFIVLGFFTWRIVTAETRNETRRIFEFYLSANEMLREDDRKWYGFELQEAIARGESIVRSMTVSPPLVHYSLGALYQKVGDHSSAAKHLEAAVEGGPANELSVVYPPRELREYVRLLRRIERAPAESPLTSSAVRSLERSRRNRGPKMLEISRAQAAIHEPEQLSAAAAAEEAHAGKRPVSITEPHPSDAAEQTAEQSNGDEKGMTYRFADFARPKRSKKTEADPAKKERKTISEVLHDIYDTNAQ
jgi:uncharacterized protein YneF (UPF0154 family)